METFPSPAPAGFDIPGSARLLDERTRRYAELLATPEAQEAHALLLRNLDQAADVVALIKSRPGHVPVTTPSPFQNQATA